MKQSSKIIFIYPRFGFLYLIRLIFHLKYSVRR